jgi:hypothetical protein
MICTSEINTITIISVLGIIIYLVLSNKGKAESEYANKLKLLDNMISQTQTTIAKKIDSVKFHFVSLKVPLRIAWADLIV